MSEEDSTGKKRRQLLKIGKEAFLSPYRAKKIFATWRPSYLLMRMIWLNGVRLIASPRARPPRPDGAPGEDKHQSGTTEADDAARPQDAVPQVMRIGGIMSKYHIRASFPGDAEYIESEKVKRLESICAERGFFCKRLSGGSWLLHRNGASGAVGEAKISRTTQGALSTVLGWQTKG